mgnify:CR=1 FL=1
MGRWTKTTLPVLTYDWMISGPRPRANALQAGHWKSDHSSITIGPLAAAGAQVTAVDVDGRRLKRLAANLARTGLAATLVEADARTFEATTPFDAVLLDAPCTATGTFRRHPEVLHRRTPEDARACAPLQQSLLAQAARLVAPGGRLVYAVCSIEPEEGALAAGQADDLGLVPVERHLLLPGLGPGDGFAIAAFTKAG